MTLLSAVALAAGLAYGGDKAPVGLRPLGFEAAQAVAKLERRPMLVVFGDGSAESRRFADTTLQDRKLRAWLDEKLVAIRLDRETDLELARRFRVRAAPAVLLLDPRAVELDRVVGYRDARALRAEAEEILKGGDALERWSKRQQEHPDDAGIALRIADLRAARGELDLALAAYLRVFERGGPTGAAALDEVRQLGRIDPKALEALAAIAQRLEPRVRAAEASEDEVRQWLDLCAASGEEQRVLATYDALAEAGEPGAALRARLAPRLRDLFYVDRRYADLEPLVGDARAALEARRKAHEELLREGAGAARAARSLKALREATARDHEVLLGRKRLGEAALLADALIALDPTVETYDALVDHALRAEAPEEARALARRGRNDERIDARRRAGIAPALPQELK